MRRGIFLFLLLQLGSLTSPPCHGGGVEVDRFFGSHMVLPRDRRVPVRGEAPVGTTVTVRFAGQAVTGEADAQGKWEIFLEPLAASTEPARLVVNDRIFEDVLVGDVWLCAGQSNMRWTLARSVRGAEEIETSAKDPALRLFDLTGKIHPGRTRYPMEVLREVTAASYYECPGWQRPSSESTPGFSAVAWHFGQRLREAEPGVPIGLVHSAVGGTPMEAWISRDTLVADLELRCLVEVPWYREDHPRYPAWCGQRGRYNLGAFLERPEGAVPHHPFEPGFLFEAGARPYLVYPLSGVIWYQGESNATTGGAGTPAVDPEWNRHLFTTLIRGWRRAAGNESLPFIFAQLPGLNRNWSLFREVQEEVARTDPHAHMAVTIDVGHPTDVHPRNKRPVGRRLAELALGVARSPEVVKIEAGSVLFDQPLRTRDGEAPRGLEVAGQDRIFRTAKASIDGRRVRLRSAAVPAPVAVRHGWENDPDLNLIAVHGGHPVAPFRTDRWPAGESSPDAAPSFTGFETAKPGPLTRATFDGVTWIAPAGHAVINAELPRTGRHCLQLRGGEHSEVIFELSKKKAPEKPAVLTFAAERWTRRDPFTFRIEASTTSGWQEIYRGDEEIRVGRAYLNEISIALPAGARRFRMTCTSPPGTGILIDDMALIEARPMEVVRVSMAERVVPVLIGQEDTPLLELEIETRGSLEPLRLRSATFEVTHGREALASLAFHAVTRSSKGRLRFPVDVPLKAGVQSIPLTGKLGRSARLDGVVRVICTSIEVGGRKVTPEGNPPSRKIGLALRQRGQDGVHTTRIPGITRTPAGTLIAVYDNRYRGGRDLPGDIDVGMSRSTDGGRTWEPMRVIMDMGDDPKWNYDGVGDPSILTDTVTGTIWVAATWSHGNRSWRGSGPGMSPEETGQLMLSKSTDDGRTWSPPINITSQVKDPEWRFVLQGPGCGITLRDGTLVFPAQFRGRNEPPVSGKPSSTIISSRDQGKTWQIGTGVKIDTTEAQVVQLADGAIMINCRDNRGGSRSVYTTTDLGQTWVEHPTSRRALPEPVCNAGLLRVVHPELGALLLFSNPATTSGRRHFTLKVSRDEGMTWPEKWHTLYDERPGSGYSVVAPIDDDHVGVLWEGPGELYFLRYSLAELLGD